MVSDSAARTYFPGGNAIGRRIETKWIRGDAPVGGEIVGIVGDVKSVSLAEEAHPTIYFVQAQVPYRGMHVVVRAEGDPMQLASAMHAQAAALDSQLPIEIAPLGALVAVATSQARPRRRPRTRTTRSASARSASSAARRRRRRWSSAPSATASRTAFSC